jgi:hypothetical protein
MVARCDEAGKVALSPSSVRAQLLVGIRATIKRVELPPFPYAQLVGLFMLNNAFHNAFPININSKAAWIENNQTGGGVGEHRSDPKRRLSAAYQLQWL